MGCGGWDGWKGKTLFSRTAMRRIGSNGCPNSQRTWSDSRVDVIAASGTLAPLAVKQAAKTIPIVMTAAGDPLGSGLVANLARPGGNVTGLSLMVPDIAGKRLELLKEILPRLVRVAVLWNASNPYPAIVFKESQAAAQRLGIEV